MLTKEKKHEILIASMREIDRALPDELKVKFRLICFHAIAREPADIENAEAGYYRSGAVPELKLENPEEQL